MKFSTRTIPAAAAMTAALMFGAQAQAQTVTSPNTITGERATPAKPMTNSGPTAADTAGTGGAAAMPAGPNTAGQTMQQRDASKPMGNTGSTAAGAAGEGGAATPPRGPNTMGKTMQQRDMAKPMAKQGSTAGSMGTGDSAAMPPGGADQPVRQAGKVAKNKAERMEKGSNPKSPMSKSNEPVRESDTKDAPTK